MNAFNSNAKVNTMKQEATGTMIVKLPKWAQEHIKKLERERDVAIRSLNEYVDGQTESAIYYDDLISTGEERGPSNKRVYIQTHGIEIKHNGVHLSLLLRENIELRCEDLNRGMNFVAFVPTSFNAMSIVSKENMR